MGQHILDFWLNLCVCQSLIVDPEASGDNLYQVRTDAATCSSCLVC